MGFLNFIKKADRNGEDDPDDDIEEFNSLFEFSALDFQELHDEEDETVYESVGKNEEQYSSGQKVIPVAETSDSQKYEGLATDTVSTGVRENECTDKRSDKKNKSAIIWNNKGVVLSRLGKYTESIEAYDQALKLDPEYSIAMNNKGVILSKLGRYAEALEVYDQALGIMPDHQVQYKIQVA